MENKKLYYYTGDLSIKSSSIIKWDKDFNMVDVLYFHYKKSMIGIDIWSPVDLSRIGEKGFTDMYRWDNFKYKFEKIMNFIEDPISFSVEASSYDSTGNVIDINQFTGGLIAHIMMKYDIPINEYSPNTIKKFATGKGNAGKPQMRKSLKLKFPDLDTFLLQFEEKPYSCIRFKPPIDDIVDSFWIGKLIEDKINKGEL